MNFQYKIWLVLDQMALSVRSAEYYYIIYNYHYDSIIISLSWCGVYLKPQSFLCTWCHQIFTMQITNNQHRRGASPVLIVKNKNKTSAQSVNQVLQIAKPQFIWLMSFHVFCIFELLPRKFCHIRTLSIQSDRSDGFRTRICPDKISQVSNLKMVLRRELSTDCLKTNMYLGDLYLISIQIN